MFRFALASKMASISAAVVCSEDEQSSLLQGRLRAAVHAKADPGFLLETVKHLAQQSKHESPEMVTAGIDSIRTALAQMHSTLEEEHIGVQRQVDHQFQEIQGCLDSSSHGTAVRDDLTAQISTMNQCRGDMNSAQGEQQRLCNAWHNHASTVTFPSTILPGSPSPADVVQLSRELREWVQSQSPTIESQNAQCDDATSRFNQEEARCSPVIADYNAIFCSHRLKCTLLEACHAHELDVYNTLMADTAAGAEAREAQWRTAAQISCILDFVSDAVTANTTVPDDSLGSCDEDVNVQHLALSFRDVEAMSPCPIPEPGDPTCPDVDDLELPQSWAGGEEEEIAPANPFVVVDPNTHDCPAGSASITDETQCHQAAAALGLTLTNTDHGCEICRMLTLPVSDGTGILLEYPGVYPSPSCALLDLASFPQYQSYTVDMLVTLVAEADRPRFLSSISWDPGPNEGTTGWTAQILGTRDWDSVIRFSTRVRGEHEYGPCFGIFRNGLQLGAEFRLTYTYDATTNALTAFVNGNIATSDNARVGSYTCHNPVTLERGSLSPSARAMELGVDGPEVPFCVGNSYPTPHYLMQREDGQIKDFKFIAGVHAP